MKVHSKKVVLVTTTFSKSIHETRAQLALKTCQACVEHGYDLIIVDGSPCAEFKKALQDAGATVIDQITSGMGASRRQALGAGIDSGADIIVWLEPEKYTLVPLLVPCLNEIIFEEADVVIPRRKNLDGYPAYQQFSEYRGNWALANATNRPDLDLFFGPRIMTPQAARMMAVYNGKNGNCSYGDNWEIIFIPMLWFLDAGYEIKSVTVDYVHPTEQLVEDDADMRGKRDKQRIDLSTAMMTEAARLSNKNLP
ncbi:MAG: hypothetical protein PHG25_00910 [Candidatus Pacebacteria bacterium]|nr:hypothetical protein [Candidatus Paceibacterota bacterium]